jgi:hypothetical protein
MAVGALSLAARPAQSESPTERCRQIGAIDFSATSSLVQSTWLVATANRPCRVSLVGGSWTNPRIETPPANVRVEFERDGFVIVPHLDFAGSDRFVASWLADRRRVMIEATVEVNAPQGVAAASSDAAFILRQVLAAWSLDYHNRRYRNVTLRIRFGLNADGTLARPWGRSDDWEPERLIAGYQGLGPEERDLVRSFAQVLRSAQPYRLPATPGPYPRTINLNFRLGDLP